MYRDYFCNNNHPDASLNCFSPIWDIAPHKKTIISIYEDIISFVYNCKLVPHDKTMKACSDKKNIGYILKILVILLYYNISIQTVVFVGKHFCYWTMYQISFHIVW